MRRLAVILALSLSSMLSFAQSEPEYLMEIGAGAGVMSYLGDFNGSIVKNMQPSASLVLRRMFNPRQGLKLQIGYGKMKGSSADVKTTYPEIPTPGYKPEGTEEYYAFNNNLFDLGVTYEYNFWPFGTGREYRGAKRITPFIFGGLGMTYVNGSNTSAFAFKLPLGVGVKFKVSARCNLNLDWTINFTTSDKLDGVEDPYGIKRSGLFKNADCYSALMVSFTYSFMEKCRVCHNQDE